MRISGKYAYVDGVPCTVSWSASERAAIQRYAASCVPDGTGVVEGPIDWTGNITGVGYLPPLPDGEDLDFVGVVSAAVGDVINYIGTILIQETTINIPLTQGVITWSANFGVQGALAKDTDPAYTDATREAAPSGKNGRISIESTLDSDTWADVEELQSVTLTFRRPQVTSVDASLLYREAGNLEADVSFQVNNPDLDAALYAVNSVRRLRAYVTNSLFYQYDSILFGEKSNFQVQRDPLQMVGYQVNGMWTAMRQRTPAALGEILLPGGAQLYGEEES